MSEHYYNGIRFVSSPAIAPVPKFQLTEKLDLRPGDRLELQAWLNDFFGFEQPMYVVHDPKAYGFSGPQKVIITTEKGLAMIKEKTL